MNPQNLPPLHRPCGPNPNRALFFFFCKNTEQQLTFVGFQMQPQMSTNHTIPFLQPVDGNKQEVPLFQDGLSTVYANGFVPFRLGLQIHTRWSTYARWTTTTNSSICAKTSNCTASCSPTGRMRVRNRITLLSWLLRFVFCLFRQTLPILRLNWTRLSDARDSTPTPISHGQIPLSTMEHGQQPATSPEWVPLLQA